MPRARRKPSAPQTGGYRARDRYDQMFRNDRDEGLIDDLTAKRAEMMDRGAGVSDIAAMDRRISDLRRKIGDRKLNLTRNQTYARELARVRRRGRVRDVLAHLACHVPEIRPDMLQAADVYRMARGVNAGWPGCRLELNADGQIDVAALFGAISFGGSDPSARWVQGRPASDLEGNLLKGKRLPPTFKPKARNKRVKRVSDGGMAAAMDRMAAERNEASRVRGAFHDALQDAFSADIVRAADRVILENCSVKVASLGIQGRRSEIYREIYNAIITGLNAVSSHLRLEFGK